MSLDSFHFDVSCTPQFQSIESLGFDVVELLEGHRGATGYIRRWTQGFRTEGLFTFVTNLYFPVDDTKNFTLNFVMARFNVLSRDLNLHPRIMSDGRDSTYITKGREYRLSNGS